MILHLVSADLTATSTDSTEPEPAFVEGEPASRDLARRRFLASFVPRIVLRLTWRTPAASDAFTYDTYRDAWQWPVPYGFTFEVRATWSLERSLPAPRPSLAVDPLHDEEP